MSPAPYEGRHRLPYSLPQETRIGDAYYRPRHLDRDPFSATLRLLVAATTGRPV